MERIDCLDKGFVRLVDHMGDDSSVVQAARVSYGNGTKTVSDDRNLIRYMMRHSHATPFEMTALKFHVKAPIVCFRQWHRHRVGVSINELSGRYSELPEECYLPSLDRLCKQSITNKQGSGEELSEEITELIHDIMEDEQKTAFKNYHKYLEKGLTREVARLNLGVSIYSEMYWQTNLRSLFHFINLRSSPHAQWEIRQYSDAMFELIKPLFPICCEAFEDYMLYSETFSRHEMDVLKQLIDKMPEVLKKSKLTKREKKEFREKIGW